jgi:hypothetical protein
MSLDSQLNIRRQGPYQARSAALLAFIVANSIVKGRFVGFRPAEDRRRGTQSHGLPKRENNPSAITLTSGKRQVALFSFFIKKKI